VADHLLALDVGTQSVRAILFAPDGTLVAMGRVPIEPYVSPQPGWAEQDPEVWWTALGDACRLLWADPGARPDSVAGIGLTTQRTTIVAADEEGRPLRPAIVWLDARRTEGLPPIGGAWGLAFRATGVRETVARFQADCEANWIATHEPSVWSRIRRYGLLSSWLTSRLVGEWVDSTACQVGYLPFDFKRSRWAGRLDWKWQVAPFRREWLPALVRPGGALGALTAPAAARLGIAPGLPLIAAAGDKQCEALGAGAITPEVAALSFGTTATIGTTHRRYLEAIPLVPPYPSAVPVTAGKAGPDAWFVELQVLRGFWMIEWFKREFGAAEVARGAALDIPPEALFETLLEGSPPGSMGLVLQPYWMPGIRYPGPEAKGAILGFGDVHGRAHVYRAILEGLAYALREGAERTVRKSRVTIRELRISGGGSQSRAAVQLFADVFGVPASRPHTHEAAGLGGAIDVAVGLGIHPDAQAAVEIMVRIADRFEPDPAANRVYEDIYGSVYLAMYDRLKPLYREIRRITGYPPPA
jgi:sugar (pentulose or hexulose) kinase